MSRAFLAKHYKVCDFVASIILEVRYERGDYNGNKFITEVDNIFADPFDPTTDANMNRFIAESEYIDEAMNILSKFHTSMTKEERMNLLIEVMKVCDEE